MIKLQKVSESKWTHGSYAVRLDDAMGEGSYRRYIVSGPGVSSKSFHAGSDIRTLAEAREVIAEAIKEVENG